MMTPEQQETFLNTMGEYVREQVEAATEPLKRRLTDLETRQKQLRYCGVWTATTPYWSGNMVTHDGSVWHCNIDGIETRPGKDPVGWTLCVKRGQDGRDAVAA